MSHEDAPAGARRSADVEAGRDPSDREHAVRFYQHDDELVEVVGRHLAEALDFEGTAIAIATSVHVGALRTWMERAGIDWRAEEQRGALVLLDAADTVGRFTDGGKIDRDRFSSIVGGAMRSLTDRGGPTRAFGEMVAILWERGDVNAAITLEEHWNTLIDELPFSLLCAYPAIDGPIGDRRLALEHVHRLHTSVDGAAASLPVDWPRAAERTFADGLASASAARHFAVEQLDAWGLDTLDEETAIVVSELATNALLHGHGAFTVALTASVDVLRIEVRDACDRFPVPRDVLNTVPGGRGLAIVAAIARGWGTEPADAGKVVWAELTIGHPAH